MYPLEGAIHTSDRRGNMKLQRIRTALLAGADLAPHDLIETAPGPGPCIVD